MGADVMGANMWTSSTNRSSTPSPLISSSPSLLFLHRHHHQTDVRTCVNLPQLPLNNIVEPSLKLQKQKTVLFSENIATVDHFYFKAEQRSTKNQ